MHPTTSKTLPVRKFVLATAAGLVLTAQAASAALVVSYGFNEGTGNAINSGTAGASGDLSFLAPATFSSDGAGITGASGDYAYTGTSGDNSGNSVAKTGADLAGLDNLTSLTITGWFNVASTGTFNGSSNIVNNQSGFGSGFLLRTESGGQMKLFINNFVPSVADSTGGIYDNSLNSWVFFAVTFDGVNVDNGDAVKFYHGDTVTAASLVSDVGRNATNTGNNNGPLHIGNQAGGNIGTGFAGMLDDIRIYDTTLDAAAIEAIRQSAIVPEPSALALGVLAFGAAVLRRRNRKS